MKILALDLAKSKSVFVDYATGGGEKIFGKVSTNSVEIKKLLERIHPDRVVIEACPSAGWICDLVRLMGIEIQVGQGHISRAGPPLLRKLLVV